ncbi:MAG TPA: DUF1501 domain-containing protein [Planctomicrobium sp.]|nr:DUF1501 domain-containing protein [Planctomicrobium sp.]
MTAKLCSRRHFLSASAFALGGMASSMLLKQDGLLAAEVENLLQRPADPQVFDMTLKEPHHPPQARAMISMFMIGGPSQIDMFDPKPELWKRHGEEFQGEMKFDNAGQASRKIMAPIAKFHPRGECGMELSDLVPYLGEIADDITLIRSMHTGVNNHVPSMFALNTGVGLAGRATLGSWLASGLGSESQELPAYVAMTHKSGMPLMGADNWTSGVLPSLYQGTVIRPTNPRILNLDPPGHLAGDAQRAQLDLISQLNTEHLERFPGETDLSARIAGYELAAKMQLAATEAFDLSKETKETQEMYGLDNPKTKHYAESCLIARRLVERGVRYIQIFNNGQSWDHHGAISTALPKCCEEIDRPSAALIKDLKQRGLLDTTLVHWGGEMGRLPVVQLREGAGTEGYGRDHNTYGFSQWMAGGGIRGGYVHGKTDDFGHHAVEGVVTHHDYLATVLHLMGLDHKQLKFRLGSREISLIENPSARIVDEILT